MSRSIANSIRSLKAILLILTGLTLGAACKSDSRCSNSEQCASGFVCNTESMSCESVSGGTDAASADASQACPEETHFCAASAPEGWAGPVVGTEVTSEVALAACPASFDAGGQVVFGGFAAEGACSCDCLGIARGLGCGPATLAARQGTSTAECNLACPFGCLVIVPAASSCGNYANDNVTAAPAVQVTLGRVTTAGSCSAAIESNDLSASFSEQARYCSAEPLAATCSDAATCLPKASDAAFDSLCVFQTGDNECPTEYPDKRLRFTDLEDTRTCSSCTCSGPAVGSSCGGILGMQASTSSPACGSTQVASNGCVSKIPGIGIAADYTRPASFECDKVGGAELSGEASPTGPVTFCCQTSPL